MKNTLHSILLLACLLLPLAAPARAIQEEDELPSAEQEVVKPAPPYGYIGTQKEARENRFLIRLKELQLTDVHLANASMEEVLQFIYKEARKQDVKIAFSPIRHQENPERGVTINKARISGWALLEEACKQAHYFFYPAYICDTQNPIEVSDEPQCEPWEWVVPTSQRKKFVDLCLKEHKQLKDYLEANGFAFSWVDPEYPEIVFSWGEHPGKYDRSDGDFDTWLTPRKQEDLARFFHKKGVKIDSQRSKDWKRWKRPHEFEDKAYPPSMRSLLPCTARYSRWSVSPVLFGDIDFEDKAAAMDSLRQKGVTFPDDNSSRVSYNRGAEELKVRGTLNVLRRVDQLVKQHNEEEEQRYQLPEDSVFYPYSELTPITKRTFRLLWDIQLPSVQLQGVSITEAFDFLLQAAKKAGHEELKCAYKENYGMPPKVSVQAENINAVEFIDLLCKQTMCSAYTAVKYYNQEEDCIMLHTPGVTLFQDFSERTGGMSCGTWNVPPAFFDSNPRCQVRGREHGSFNGRVSSDDAMAFFEAHHVEFPEGTTLSYNYRTEELQVIGNSSMLRAIKQLIKYHSDPARQKKDQRIRRQMEREEKKLRKRERRY